MSESDRIALVTGANRGIGREVVRQLAERRYKVLLSARHGEQAVAVQPKWPKAPVAG